MGIQVDLTKSFQPPGALDTDDPLHAEITDLLNVNEILGLRLVSIHNSHLFLQVMADIYAHLAAGTFGPFREQFIREYVPSRRVLAGRLTD